MSTGGNIRPPHWPWAVTSTSALTTRPAYLERLADGDPSCVSSEALVTLEPRAPRCAYCGTRRSRYDFTNCPNCGAPAT